MNTRGMTCVGNIQFPFDKEVSSIFTTDFLIFYWKTGSILNDEDMFQYALCLNSPWNAKCETYTTRFNLFKFKFVTTLHVIGPNLIESEIFGYGKTREESLKNCKKILKYIQDKFNPNGEYM